MKLGDREILCRMTLLEGELDRTFQRNSRAWDQLLLKFRISLNCLPKASSLLVGLIQQERTVEDVISILESLNLHKAASYIYDEEDLKMDEKSSIMVAGDCSIDKDGSLQVKAEGTLRLILKVSGKPMPSFHWYRNKMLFSSHDEQTLTIRPFRKDLEGEYQCIVTQERIFGIIRKKFPKKFTIKVCHELQQATYPQPSEPLKLPVYNLSPTKKRALIFANGNYRNYGPLDSPKTDGSQLHSCLGKKYGFTCTTKSDLSGKDMKKELKFFCENLESNTLVLFYFAGHGFTNSTLVRMLGTDAPEEFEEEHVLSETELFNGILDKEPCKAICIFDTCLTERPNKLHGNTLEHPLKDKLIHWNATSPNCEAFEFELENSKQSVFIHHFLKVFDGNHQRGKGFLSMALKTNESITHFLKEAERQDPQSPQQYPELNHVTSPDFIFEPVAQNCELHP